ncbi:uncharacterized protein SCHCODRAFT_02641768 [Schizophyllum commune H4-8]|uniref:uncharacterized protein n=1 Tax=Schizophyllum commune (strain H4-8 / FGSC 9210) TaxID=578458 RepID=UPI00215F0095|nr:uncharacterized protein SCHCODRAFT_02641768 [Schizophyllum commune H4-8]KAI5886447.1 hypothetical protein SCHCODRAFT_02641768 [Schizophyllum commune H4-8]
MESATAPLITNTLWTLSTAAFVLGLYVRSYKSRVIIFCALSSIIYYQLVYTSTGDPPNDYFLASAYTSIWFMAVDQLILTDPHRALRARNQTKLPSEMTPWDRLCWALQLRMNPRGISWNFEPPKHALAQRPKSKSRLTFILNQLLASFFDLVLLDVASVICRSIPELSASGPPLASVSMGAWCPLPEALVGKGIPVDSYPCGWLTRVGAVAGYGFSAYAAIGIGHRMLSIVSVTLGALLNRSLGGWGDPTEWPHLMGPLGAGCTVGGVWGCTWHQMLRRCLTRHAEVLVCILYGPPEEDGGREKKDNDRAGQANGKAAQANGNGTQANGNGVQARTSGASANGANANGVHTDSKDSQANHIPRKSSTPRSLSGTLSSLYETSPTPKRSRSLARGILKVYATFFVSGVIHSSGDARILGSWSASRALPFFLTQASAIMFERGVIHVAKKTLGLRDAWYWRVVGVLWTFTLLGATLPMWIDPIAAAGVMDEGADFGAVNQWVLARVWG